MSQEEIMSLIPSVWQVLPADDYKVYAYMNDGSVRLYDVKPLIKDDTVFAPLKDVHIFESALTEMNDTVAWDIKGNRDPYECIDIDPFSVFDAPMVEDPLDSIVS
jgi:hypothetical protein